MEAPLLPVPLYLELPSWHVGLMPLLAPSLRIGSPERISLPASFRPSEHPCKPWEGCCPISSGLGAPRLRSRRRVPCQQLGIDTSQSMSFQTWMNTRRLPFRWGLLLCPPRIKITDLVPTLICSKALRKGLSRKTPRNSLSYG